MTETAVATADQPTALTAQAADTAERLEIVKTAIGLPDLTNNELRFAIEYARARGADLISRQIHVVRMDGKLTFITSIDFARVIALRSGKYRGQGNVVYGPDCDCDGEPIKLERRHPEWAEVPIINADFEAPIIRRAYFHEYAPLERGSRDGEWVIRHTWRKMPSVMISKVSEALGIRVAFPNDMAGLYTSEEMEQAEDGGPRLAAGVSAADVPDEPDLPFESKYVGAVKVDVDGIRTVKAPDWWKGDTENGKVEKLEVQITVGRSKHTALLMGPPGDSLVEAVNELRLKEGERVVVEGRYHEYQWSDDAKKPKAKQLRDVTRLAVLRGNVWHEAGVLEGEATEVAEAAPEDPTAATPTPPTPSSTTASSESSPRSATAEASAPASGSRPSAGSATETTTTSAEAGSSTPDATTDMTEAADAIFGDMLPDADVDPTRGGAAELAAPVPVLEQLTEWPGEEDGTDSDMSAIIVTVEQRKTSNGRPFTHLWLKPVDQPLRFQAAIAGAEAEAQGVNDLGAGELVRVIGGWKNHILVLTAVQAI